MTLFLGRPNTTAPYSLEMLERAHRAQQSSNENKEMTCMVAQESHANQNQFRFKTVSKRIQNDFKTVSKRIQNGYKTVFKTNSK